MVKRWLKLDTEDKKLILWLFFTGIKSFFKSGYKDGLKTGWCDLTDCWGWASFHLRNDVRKSEPDSDDTSLE